jgi:hypothetical protein
MSDFTVKVPRQVAEYAQQRARQEYLKPSEVVRSLMTRGMFADQMERSRQQDK